MGHIVWNCDSRVYKTQQKLLFVPVEFSCSRNNKWNDYGMHQAHQLYTCVYKATNENAL